jgi:hypothetical protein
MCEVSTIRTCVLTEQATHMGVVNWLDAIGQKSVAGAWLMSIFNKDKNSRIGQGGHIHLQT